MTYIFTGSDGNGGEEYIKKCETENCSNHVFIGFSRCFCEKCVSDDPLPTIISNFNQMREM